MNSLQAMRAVAVSLVVYCHVMDYQPNHNSSGISFQHHFFYLENFGAVGVDIFFVISGFIITIISRQYAASNTAGLFFIKRIIRIVPIYWLVSAAVVLCNYILTHRLTDKSDIIKTIFFFPFFDHTYFDPPVLFVGWTLSFEMFFYLVAWVSMLISPKKSLLVTVILMLLFIMVNYITRTHSPLMIFFGDSIVLEFLFGVAIGYIFLSSTVVSPIICNILLCTGIAALLATVIFGYGEISECANVLGRVMSLMRVALWGLPAALLVAGAVLKERWRTAIIHPWFILLGDASYSIYLIHSFFLALLYIRLIKWGVTETVPPDLLIILSLLLAIAVGCIFYKLVELPLLRYLNRLLETRMHRKILSTEEKEPIAN